VNNGEITGFTYDGKNWLYVVNMIQFFRLYDIEFYRGSSDYEYKLYEM